MTIKLSEFISQTGIPDIAMMNGDEWWPVNNNVTHLLRSLLKLGEKMADLYFLPPSLVVKPQTSSQQKPFNTGRGPEPSNYQMPSCVGFVISNINDFYCSGVPGYTRTPATSTHPQPI